MRITIHDVALVFMHMGNTKLADRALELGTALTVHRVAPRLCADEAAHARDLQRLLDAIVAPKPAGCWLVKTSVRDKDGYGVMSLRGRKRRMHRAMFDAFNPGAVAPVVRHTCHNPNCINPLHLAAGTQKENAADRVAAARGGDLRGVNNGRSKLSEADVLAIKKSRLSGAALADHFGISKSMACRIKSGKAWPHLHSHQVTSGATK